MIEPIFTTPRKGYLGQRPMGAEYMAGIEARAKMLRRATRLGDDDPQDERQLRLPLTAQLPQQEESNANKQTS